MLKEVRREVADLLQAEGIDAYHYEPARLNPPLVVVTAGDPYISTGETFNTNTMRLDIVVLCKKGTPEMELDALDDTVEEVLSALHDDWSLEQVSEPYFAASGQANIPAVRMTVTASVTL